eukprot:gene1901-2159_t
MGETLPHLMKRYPQYARTTIYNHSRLPIGDMKVDKRHLAKGRPAKLNARDVRKLSNSLKKLRESYGNFTSKDVERDCRKKGQLVQEDLKKRLKFARKCKKLPENFWKEAISFYFDGTGWPHKTNPCMTVRTSRTLIWKKRCESLSLHCTARGKKEGSGSRMARFMVAISYGRGVISCIQYNKQIDGEFCYEFIREHFPGMFENSANAKGKLFLQDGDPNQNSKRAHEGIESIGCRVLKIPARSPDLNPIENVFHLVGTKLQKDSLEKNIVKETYEQFCNRIKKTMMEFPSEVIDRTIASMPKRMNMVLKSRVDVKGLLPLPGSSAPNVETGFAHQFLSVGYPIPQVVVLAQPFLVQPVQVQQPPQDIPPSVN